ncbi:TIGR04066 family peptide maturation system protein [Clostridiaceae bacterium M8S5]|nr:TIGR04066 family peptide maturation system protein [Clostridiaceae bacterium M8S5]
MRAIIYPFSSETVYFIRNKKMIKDYEVVGAVAPNGWGFKNKDAGYADGGQDTNIRIKDNFEDIEFDVAFLVDSKLDLEFDYMYSQIEKITKKNKEIINLRRFKDEELKKIEELCKKTNTTFKNLLGKKYKLPDVPSLIDISIPVIFVAGLADRTHKFDIQLALRENIMKKGYRVSQVGTKNGCELFGFHSFPEFMFDNTIEQEERIKMFNLFVKSIEVIEKPDVIIIGVPRSLMPVCKKIPDGFGCMGYMVSNAVKPDAAIVSLMYNHYKKENIQEIQNVCKYRFGFEVDCFNIANNQLDHQDSSFFLNKLYTVIDHKYIDEQIKKEYSKYQVPFFNVHNEEDKEKMADYLIDVLAGEEFIEDVL